MSITISNIRDNHKLPFINEDDALKELFSYFLHEAPTIDSAFSIVLKPKDLNLIWNQFISEWDESELTYKIYSENSKYPNEEILKDKYSLSDDSIVNRKSRSFICFRKDQTEHSIETLLRHLRTQLLTVQCTC